MCRFLDGLKVIFSSVLAPDLGDAGGSGGGPEEARSMIFQVSAVSFDENSPKTPPIPFREASRDRFDFLFVDL